MAAGEEEEGGVGEGVRREEEEEMGDVERKKQSAESGRQRKDKADEGSMFLID